MPNDYTFVENQASLKALQDLEKHLLDVRLEENKIVYIIPDKVFEIIKLEKENYG